MLEKGKSFGKKLLSCGKTAPSAMKIVHPMKFWLWGNLNTCRRRRRWDSSLSDPRSLLCGCPELQPRRMCRRMGAPSITHSWGCLRGHSVCCPGSLKASFGITRGQGRPANASWGWGIRQQVSSPCRLSAILFLFFENVREYGVDFLCFKAGSIHFKSVSFPGFDRYKPFIIIYRFGHTFKFD